MRLELYFVDDIQKRGGIFDVTRNFKNEFPEMFIHIVAV